MAFIETNIKDLKINPFTTIGKDWMLITAGNENKINTMTASWGGMGHLWGEDVVTIYIRPQRYTKKFVDEQNEFSLTFFDGYKKELSILGTVSGKDTDKINDVDFHPIFLENVPAFQEAKLVMIAEKIYEDTIKPESFKNKELDEKHYPNKDYHTVYIAKIKKVYINK